MTLANPALQQSPFTHKLCLKAKIEAKGSSQEIYASEIIDLSFNLHPYGFEGSCEFSSMKNDKVHEIYEKKAPIKLEFTFKPAGFDNASDDPIFELKGLVTYKSFKKVDAEAGREDEPIRIYQFRFCDAAKEQWAKHFPMRIYVDETMKKVFEEHKNADIKITYNFPELEKQYPILAFKLRYTRNKAFHEQCSFYSFIHWYLEQENGIWSYDYKKHEYSIEAQKVDEGEAYSIYDRWLLAPRCLPPELQRHNLKIHAHDADANTPKDEENEEVYEQMLREEIDYASNLLYPEVAEEQIKSLTGNEEDQVEIEVCEFRDDFHLDKLLPGALVKIKPNETMKGAWSHDPAYKDQTFRSSHVMFRASQYAGFDKVRTDVCDFQLRIVAVLEKQKEKFVQRPYFHPPSFPFSIHGKVFSDVGEKEQSTYKLAESEAFPKGHYLVDVPLIEGDKKVIVPFFPDYMTGQFYFPLEKNEKVLLNIFFRTAKIQKSIDWQFLARMPLGIQGNQIVFSSNGKDKHVIMTHEFEDGKESVWTLKQSSSDKQTQTIRIKEKEIEAVVEEKEKKTVRAVLNSSNGLLLSLEDKEGSITQQTHFDGKSMTHTCKGDKTSTIVQKPDSIAVEADTFSVKSETIILTASDSIAQTGKSQVNIETKSANIAASSVNLGK